MGWSRVRGTLVAALTATALTVAPASATPIAQSSTTVTSITTERATAPRTADEGPWHDVTARPGEHILIPYEGDPLPASADLTVRTPTAFQLFDVSLLPDHSLIVTAPLNVPSRASTVSPVFTVYNGDEIVDSVTVTVEYPVQPTANTKKLGPLAEIIGGMILLLPRIPLIGQLFDV